MLKKSLSATLILLALAACSKQEISSVSAIPPTASAPAHQSVADSTEKAKISTANGPFGLAQGMTLAQIGGKPEKIAPGKWRLASVPKPHSAFDEYIVQIGTTSGLCWIKGIGKIMKTSAYGSEVRSQFTDLKERLSANYGKSEDFDRLLPGSIWNEPRDWMMALLKKERVLLSSWSHESGATLNSELKSVGLVASALGTEEAFISVDYAFSNEDKCEAEIKKEEDGAL